MKVPVIMYLPRQEALEASAVSARQGAPLGILDETVVPSGVEVDRQFSAVPVGTGQSDLETMESLEPQASQNFAVRGSVQVDRIEDVPETADGVPLFADPEIASYLTCIGNPPVGATGDVATALDVAALHADGLDGDGVAIAILDTGINLDHLNAQLGRNARVDPMNSWTPPGMTVQPFQHAIGHGTMCAYDALIAAPKATLLDFPVLLGSAPGASAMGRRLSIALLGFSQLLAFWGIAFAPGGGARYKALVVNNSWGMFHPSWDFPAGHPGRYSDNPNHPFNVVVSTLARTNADILFAAGNCGADCPDGRCQGLSTDVINGANALAEVLTIAGCDVNDDRVGYSSQGPAIAGMAANKPDITGYTHFLGSEAFGQGEPDSGTSAACPVVAGCVAALRTKADPTANPPASLFAQLHLSARQVQGAGWNRDYGFGIINPVAAAGGMGLV